MMRFLIGLAAATYTATTIGPVGWFIIFWLLVVLAATLLWWWPLFLVVAIIYGTWRFARWVERARAMPYRDIGDHEIRAAFDPYDQPPGVWDEHKRKLW